MADLSGVTCTPKVEIRNWGMLCCTPDIYSEPETAEQLKKVLAFARENGRKVRMIGMGHSPSDLTMTSDIMISMEKMNQIIKVDKAKQQVTVEAGILYRDLSKCLSENGLALSVLPSVLDMTVGGAVGTSSHGSGIKYGTVSSYIVNLQLLTADGLLMFCSPDENSDVFFAACCGLGALGVLVQLTLQCEDDYNLIKKDHGEKLASVLENLDHYLKSSDHFKFFWYPHTDDVAVLQIDRTKEKPRRSLAALSWRLLLILGSQIILCLYWLGRNCHQLVPLANRLGYWLQKHQLESVDFCRNVFQYDYIISSTAYIDDWAVPVENTAKAVIELKKWLDSCNGEIVAHFPVEVRFVKADNLWISPASGMDTAFIHVSMHRPFGADVSKDAYFKAYESIMAKYGGRPHWAMQYDATPEYLCEKYPNFNNWCRLRKLLDPTDIFVNDNIARILPVNS